MFNLFKYSDKETPLPNSRLGQFGYILRFHWRSLALLSTLTSLFAIPLVVWMYWSTMANSALYAKLLSLTDYAQKVELATQLKGQMLFNGLVYIPLTAVAFVGLGGCAQCIKMYAKRQIVFVSQCFWRGVKQHFWGSFVTGALYASAVCAVLCSDLFFGTEWWWNVVGVLALVVVSIFVSYCFVLNVFYKQSLKALLLNATALTFVRFPQNALALALSMITVWLVVFLPSVLGVTLCVIVNLVIGIGYSTLIIVLNAFSAFDKYINKTQYPSLYREGLQNNSDAVTAEGANA